MASTIKIMAGDLLLLFDGGRFDALMHGCNCFASMSGGIAAAIARRYPQAREADKAAVERVRQSGAGRRSLLGTYSECVLPQGTILNLYTQYYPGPDFRMEAFRSALRLVKEKNHGIRFGMPWIGCGIGGASRPAVLEAVAGEMEGEDVTIVELEARIQSLIKAAAKTPLHRVERPVFSRL